MPLPLPRCEVPACGGPVFALAWVAGLRIHHLCMEHVQNYIDATISDGISVRCMPLPLERLAN